MDPARVRVVLVRPRIAGNIGAVARALKCMGLRQLVLVAPPRFDRGEAGRRAVHARDVLDRARIVPSLADGIGDCGVVVGTTGRPVAARTRITSPRLAAGEIVAAAARQPVALLFGPEDHGLSNDELARCQHVVTIPTDPAYPSLNLAHAVTVVAYELLLARRQGHAIPEAPPRAAAGRLEFMYARLEESLGAIGFLHPGNARHMMGTLRRMLSTAHLDDHAVSVLLGIARQVRWAAARMHERAGGAGETRRVWMDRAGVGGAAADVASETDRSVGSRENPAETKMSWAR